MSHAHRAGSGADTIVVPSTTTWFCRAHGMEVSGSRARTEGDLREFVWQRL